MFDFTFLFVVFLMLLAWQSGLPLLAGALFVVLVFIAKSKYLSIALAVAGGMLLLLGFGATDPLMIGVLVVVIFLLIVKKEEDSPQQGYNPGGM